MINECVNTWFFHTYTVVKDPYLLRFVIREINLTSKLISSGLKGFKPSEFVLRNFLISTRRLSSSLRLNYIFVYTPWTKKNR